MPSTGTNIAQAYSILSLFGPQQSTSWEEEQECKVDVSLHLIEQFKMRVPLLRNQVCRSAILIKGRPGHLVHTYCSQAETLEGAQSLGKAFGTMGQWDLKQRNSRWKS